MRRGKRNILILDGHPDQAVSRLVHGLAGAYGTGAEAVGHGVRTVSLATLDISLLRSRDEWEKGEVPPAIYALQHDILWADHLVILFPLWLGDMPAMLKALLEHVLRPGFGFVERGGRLCPRLGGRSARLVVTMGMPGFVYRLWLGAHAARLLRRSILGLVGIRPVRLTLFGNIEGHGRAERALIRMAALGRGGL